MRKVIIICQEPKEESKGVEFTHCLTPYRGCIETDTKPNEIEKCIVYLGKCETDGDMFAVYWEQGTIAIYKGHLNNGTY